MTASPDDESPRVPAWFPAGVAVTVFAVVAAAVGGPWILQRRELHFGGRPVEEPTVTPASPGAPGVDRPHFDFDWTWLVWVVGAALVLAGVAIAWLLWRHFRRPTVALAPPPAGGLGSSADIAPDVPVLERGVAAALATLDQIVEPDNAIIAAWLALEEAAASSGVPRQPAETPSEFTLQVLHATPADRTAVWELLHLYHRARFSAHGVGPAEVGRAKECLRLLALSWSAAASPGGGRVER